MTTSSDTLRVPAFKRKKALKAKMKKAAKKAAPKKRHLAKRVVKKIRKIMHKKMKPMKMQPMKKKVAKTVQAKRPQTLKRPARSALTAAPSRAAKLNLQPVGKVTHYYDRIGVGVLKLSNVLRVGDRLRLRGKKGDFNQTVRSIQIEHNAVDTALKGADIGIKVDQAVKTDAIAYKLP